MPVIYETDADIPSFAGLNLDGDGYNMSLRYAREVENVNTTGGGFTQMRNGTPIAAGLPSAIETLAILHRRFNVSDTQQDIIVAVAGGRIYTKFLDGDDLWKVRYEGMRKNKCSCVTYEVNDDQSDRSVDVLLLSNNVDGMLMLRGDDLTVSAVPTPYKFDALCMSNERVWGTGVDGDPDLLVYSAPYNPLDWSTNEELPADGGGEIRQPSWDGDSFIALRNFGSYLLAFKKDSVWRVSGTNPGEYYFRQQYGHGTVEENTIAVTQSHVYMMGWDGIIRYDGSGSYPFQQQMLADLLRKRLNYAARSQMCAGLKDQHYLLALPLDGSQFNNAVLEYNPSDQAFLLRTGVSISMFLTHLGRVFYVSANSPGVIYEMNEQGSCLPVKWVSGYQDLGAKNSVKSAFTVYFVCDAEVKFPLTIAIRTEKKIKKKRLIITPRKAYRTNINVSGRYFRIEIETDTTTPFRIDGGIRLHMELDPD